MHDILNIVYRVFHGIYTTIDAWRHTTPTYPVTSGPPAPPQQHYRRRQPRPGDGWLALIKLQFALFFMWFTACKAIFVDAQDPNKDVATLLYGVCTVAWVIIHILTWRKYINKSKEA